MRPYEFDPKYRAFKVALCGDRYPVLRANRTAAGMSYTYSRHPKPPKRDKDEVLRLVVYGTTAKAHGVMFRTEHAPCPCCGSKAKGKLLLGKGGKVRLRALRQRRAARLALTDS